jgi:hypothetical protein
MMNTYKIITVIFPFILLCSCAREAEVLDAPNSLNEQFFSLQAYSAEAGEMENTVRAMTLLFYPRPEQIRTFSYQPMNADAQNSWNSVLQTTPYADRIVQNYPALMEPDLKVQKLVAAIQAVGRSRDNAWRQMQPLDERMKAIESEKTILNEKIKELEPELKWRDYTCFYESRPRRGANYDCRAVRDETFSKRKRPRSCEDFLSFDFTFNDDQGDIQTNFESAKTDCAAVLPQIEEIEVVITSLNQEFDALNEKFEPLFAIRKSGEGVVLDILQTAERYTLALGNPEVYVATGSTIEKPNNQEILSEVKINWETKEIEVFKLFIEFGLNYSGGVNSLEYSIENGRIQDMRLEFVGPNPRAVFKLLTDDFWIECELDITNDDPTMGLRMVGEVFAHFPDGTKTRGGMKLEFNTKNP